MIKKKKNKNKYIYIIEKKFNKKKKCFSLLSELKQLIKIMEKAITKIVNLLNVITIFLFCFVKNNVINFIFNNFYLQNMKYLTLFIFPYQKFMTQKLIKLKKKFLFKKHLSHYFEFFVTNLLKFFAGSNYSFFPNKFSVFLASGLKDDSCLIKSCDFFNVDFNLLDLKNISLFLKSKKFGTLSHIKEFICRGNFIVYNKSPRHIVLKTFVFKYIKYNKMIFRYLRFNYSYLLAIFLYLDYKIMEFLNFYKFRKSLFNFESLSFFLSFNNCINQKLF